ncbi:MAG: LptE family protein [Pseudomonadota bacterium]
MSRPLTTSGPLLVLLVLAALGLSGCGYSFVGGLTNVPPGARTIAIPVFGNKTAEAGIETDFANSLALDFNRSGILSVVAPPADLTLSGTIEEMILDGVAYNSRVIAVERRVRLRLSARLTEDATGKVFWAAPAIIDNQVYRASSDPQVSEFNRREAIRTIAERVAFQIHNRALEGF